MRMTAKCLPALAAGAFLMSVAVPAIADRNGHNTVTIPLHSYEEVPAVSSGAEGAFRARIDSHAGTISYELSYDGLEGAVRQAHIHVGQKSVNGGISVFLCQTATNPDPTGQAPQCTAPPALITGVIDADNIIGPAGQGVAAGQFEELVAAIRARVAYVNVHSSLFPGGEVRGQLDRGRRGDHDDDDD